MKKSEYSYLYEINKEYVGYSWLTDSFAAFPIEEKDRVNRLIEYPDSVFTNRDAEIYRELCKKKFLTRDNFNGYEYMMYLHHQFIYRTDWLAFSIMPTMGLQLQMYVLL